MTVALAVGKFLPPHAGHHHLVREAARHADRTVVAVVDGAGYPIPAADRAGWMAEEHPDADVVVVSDVCGHWDSCPPGCSQKWADHIRATVGAPDVVVSSEEYGEPFARLMGARHVMVDLERGRFPVSGTAVRSDPAANWGFLSPAVRAHYAVRVAVVGAESTGTTALARALAARHRTAWVREYGREHALPKGMDGDWSTGDFTVIARTQQEWEDASARQAEVSPSLGVPLLFCDTDALATAVWHERYMGFRSPEVERVAASRRYALYVLTDCDIPFEQDGTRDGEHLREWMTDRFADALSEREEPWLKVSGSVDERMDVVDSELRRLSGAGA